MTKLPDRPTVNQIHTLQKYDCPACGKPTLSGVTSHDVKLGDMVRLRCTCGWRGVRALKTNNVLVHPATVEDSYEYFLSKDNPEGD